MKNDTEWSVSSDAHSIQHITYGSSMFVIRNKDAVYIGDGSTWEPATAAQVYDYFVKIDLNAKERFKNMSRWHRIKAAFKGEL